MIFGTILVLFPIFDFYLITLIYLSIRPRLLLKARAKQDPSGKIIPGTYGRIRISTNSLVLQLLNCTVGYSQKLIAKNIARDNPYETLQTEQALNERNPPPRTPNRCNIKKKGYTGRIIKKRAFIK